MIRPKLPPQKQVSRNSKNEEYHHKGYDINFIIGTEHVEFLERSGRRFEVAILRRARQLRPIETVRRESCSLETISNIREVRDPS